MNCKTAQSYLSAYLDEELSGREMLDIREHLRDCEECAEEARCVQTLKHVLGAAPVPEPSADFEDRLVSTVMSAAFVKPEAKRISLFALTGIAAASMLATMLLINTVGGPKPSATVAEHPDEAVYKMIQRDQAMSASADPLSGSPIIPVSFKGQ
jgi:predicted anti-sigma-YlaC factor YlaD